MFQGAAFCPKCGAARTRAENEATAARCPACKSELHRIDVGTTPLYECASCDGMWVDADVFDRLCASRESQAAVLPRLSQSSGTKAGPVRYRPCVRCGKMMNRVNFGSLSGAVIDVCKGHGTFLDAGELHQIVSFIQGGGLDRARAQKVDELREEQRRLQDLQRKAVREAGRAQTHPADRFDAGDVLSLIDLINGH
jgi:Zn-finger nucleic acid-binding protein